MADVSRSSPASIRASNTKCGVSGSRSTARRRCPSSIMASSRMAFPNTRPIALRFAFSAERLAASPASMSMSASLGSSCSLLKNPSSSSTVALATSPVSVTPTRRRSMVSETDTSCGPPTTGSADSPARTWCWRPTAHSPAMENGTQSNGSGVGTASIESGGLTNPRRPPAAAHPGRWPDSEHPASARLQATRVRHLPSARYRTTPTKGMPVCGPRPETGVMPIGRSGGSRSRGSGHVSEEHPITLRTLLPTECPETHWVLTRRATHGIVPRAGHRPLGRPTSTGAFCALPA